MVDHSLSRGPAGSPDRVGRVALTAGAVVLAIFVGITTPTLIQGSGTFSVFLIPAAFVLTVWILMGIRSPDLMIHLAIWYVTLLTLDVKIMGIPLKIPLVSIALLVWFVRRRSSRYALQPLVLAVALGAPLFWILVAEMNTRATLGGASTRTLVIEQASRFFYLLLYFPIADLITTTSAERANRAWLWPAYGLCAITILLWAAHVFAGVDYGYTGEVFAFKGVIEDLPSGAFRLFIANHIILIPAAAVLIALLMTGRATAAEKAGLFVVATTIYISQTRGIWLGVVAALVIALMFAWAHGSIGRVLVVLAAGAMLLAVTPLGRQVTERAVISQEESSIRTRYEQAPLIWEAFREHPLVGQGLGATLETGYVRSEEDPYSFELTYLQILFQMGIFGALLFLMLHVGICVQSYRAMRRLTGRDRALAIGTVSASCGLFLANSTNPYLFSSFGMLTLAILLAITHRVTTVAAASEPTPAGPLGEGGLTTSGIRPTT